MISKEKFTFLKGKWSLKRMTNGFGHMDGQAIFTLLHDDEPTLLYREEGIFVPPTAIPFNFYKEYLYCFHHDEICVYFALKNKKNGLFLSLNPHTEVMIGTHTCGKDFYQATYQFLENDRFTLRVDVTGPQKGFVIQTTFTRVPEALGDSDTCTQRE